jgi:bifunctional DNA-binding transcriptional regulator/antitoxin component of YhaV-PrlF toxin-antitoxin module
MKAVIDRDGRIALTREVQSQLGVKPGDEVVFETQNNGVLIKAAHAATGLCWEGNVLVHRGTSGELADSGLQQLRDERFEQLLEPEVQHCR